MGQDHVVAAFRVSGDAPSKGARVTELLLVKVDAGQEIARLRLPEDAAQASGEPALAPVVFSRLVEFVGASSVVTHDGYNWKRFLRQEFASQPKNHLKDFLARTVDVSEWSQHRFPRQRKDVESLCARLKIELPGELKGLEREAVAICSVTPHMQQSPLRPESTVQTIAPAPLRPKAPPKAKQAPLPVSTRLRRAWEILVGNGS